MGLPRQPLPALPQVPAALLAPVLPQVPVVPWAVAQWFRPVRRNCR
jgi:hypothetical protein